MNRIKYIIVKIIEIILGNKLAYKMGRSLYLMARYEEPNNMYLNGEIEIQKQFMDTAKKIDKEVIIFDVGANEGEWVNNLFKNDNFQQDVIVHAFEPIQSTFEKLKNKFEKWDNIVLVNKALSDKTGLQEMNIIEGKNGSNSFYTYSTNKEKVELTTVTEYCDINNINYINYLKIDTEGNDYYVIKGAERFFKQEKIDVCQFEYNYLWIEARLYLKDVFDLLKDMPYNIGKICKSKVIFYEKWSWELEKFFEGNYIIVHKNQLKRFKYYKGFYDDKDMYNVMEKQETR